MSGNYSACTQQTVSAPARKQIEVCAETRAPEERTCEKVLTVTVTTSQSCVPGTWFARRERRSQQRGPHDRVRLLRSGARPRASARPGLRRTVRMARARDPSPSRSIRQGPAHLSARAISSLTGRTPVARRRRRSSPAAAPGIRCSARFDFAQLVRTFDPKTRTFVFVPTWLWSFWVSYQLPEVFVTEADSWNNQCSAYEARL